jgi:2'-hydroxyisoflavone reductase
MGTWTVRLTEDRISGAFTAARPSTTFAAMVEETLAALDSDADVVQVDGDWLVQQGVDGAQLPLWSEGSPELALAMDTSRAEATGLTHRPFAEVVRDTLAWAEAHPDQATNPRVGLSPEREQELLLAWAMSQA